MGRGRRKEDSSSAAGGVGCGYPTVGGGQDMTLRVWRCMDRVSKTWNRYPVQFTSYQQAWEFVGLMEDVGRTGPYTVTQEDEMV